MWSSPKQEIFRSLDLRRVVATLPCVNCWIVGWTQAAHIGGLAQGKGGALKVPDSYLAALCGPHPDPVLPSNPLLPGCHNDYDEHRLDPQCGWEFIARTYILLVERGIVRVKLL
jgi:hypothetical protein